MLAKAHKAAGARLCRALALALFALPAWGEVFFVRPSTGEYGLEDGSSYAAAFDGFADITWAASDTAGSVDAGDTLYVCGSFAYSSADGGGATMLSVDAAGAVGEPITIDGDCSAQGDLSQAIVDAENNASAQRGFWLRANAYIDVRNVLIKNINNATNAIGVQMYNATTEGATAKNINLYNVDVENVFGGSLSFKCISGYGTGISVQESDISGCSDDGIYLHGANNSARNNRIERVSLETTGGDCVQITGGTSSPVSASGALIEENECDHATVDAKQCYVLDAGTGIQISAARKNRCRLPIGATVSNGIYVEHDTTTVKGNWIEGGNQGIATGTGATNPVILANITTKTTSRGISTGSASTGAKVVNNTTHDCNDGSAAGGCIVVDANSAGVEVTNNAISGSLGAGIDVQGASVVEQYNLIHDTTTPKSTNCSSVGCAAQAGTLDVTDIEADPLFLGGPNPTTAEGFRLSASSPLIGAGTDPGDEIPDFFGDLMYDGKWDIGAFRRDSCYRRSRDGKLDMARTRAQVVSRCLGIPGRYPEGL